MRKRYALTVGNNYPGTNAELSGCVNDAHDWAQLLQRNDYEVETLIEGTRTAVLDRLRELVSKAGFADRIVFTYSGHGTWVPDRSGDEPDRRDEAMVMAGLSVEDLLLDDDIQDVFEDLHYGTAALILSDSCFSGTVSRFSSPLAPAKGVRKFISPVELDVPITLERALELEERSVGTPRKTANLISGCSDLEYSYDAVFDGRPNGAFSRVALDAYSPGMSLNTWFRAIRATLPSEDYPQTPLLTASSYRKYTWAL